MENCLRRMISLKRFESLLMRLDCASEEICVSRKDRLVVIDLFEGLLCRPREFEQIVRKKKIGGQILNKRFKNRQRRHFKTRTSLRTHLTNSSDSQRFVTELFEDLIERLVEDCFDTLFGVLERVRLSICMKLSQKITEFLWEQILS